MKRLLLLLPVILAVLASGCTMPGGIELPFFNTGVTYESDVVVVKDLRAIPGSVRAGEQVRLIAYIENTGKNTVPDNDALSDDLKGTPITVELYDYCSGLFSKSEIEQNCMGSRETGKTSCPITKLLPGEVKEVDWTLKSDRDVKLMTPCELKVSVQYPYATRGLTTITFIEQGEYQRQLEQGTFSPKSHYTVKGEGPVKAFFTVKDQEPIQATTEESFTSVSLDFQNLGYGFLANPTPGEGSPRILNSSVDVTIPEELKKFSDCELTLDGGEIKLPEDVKLIQNKRSLPCRIRIMDDDKVNKEATFQLEAKASYLYEFRDSARVTVNPPI